mmetsp:Transcript_89702/g.155230  ORF Transcript_89702/g.155230 Transcript_89702/m.155230 type:complete len:378 (+) Transcript_89702:97-1230(+)
MLFLLILALSAMSIPMHPPCAVAHLHICQWSKDLRVHWHFRVLHVCKPTAGQALGCKWPLRGLGLQDTADELHGLWAKWLLVPLAQHGLNATLTGGVEEVEGLVAQRCLVPGRNLECEDEQANAHSPHVGRGRCIAPEIGHADSSRLHGGRQSNLTEVLATVYFHTYDVTGFSSRRSYHPHLLKSRYVAFRRTVEVLTHCTEEANRDSRISVAFHSHAKVHQSQHSILEQDVLQGNIAMSDVVPMKVTDSLKQLPSVLPHHALTDTAFGHLIEQLPSFSKLSDKPCCTVDAVRKATQHPQQVHWHIRLLGQVAQDPNLRQRVLRIWSVLAGLDVHLVLVRLGTLNALQLRVSQLLHSHDCAGALWAPAIFEDVTIDA